MQIPLKWINELVNIDSLTLESLIDKLTLGGFEVEEIIELEQNGKKELALDISATANRSDSLSIQGLAIEMAALLDQPIKYSNYSIDIKEWKENLRNYSQINTSDEYCSVSVNVIVENLEVTESPKWLQQKLISSGIEPENNLTDFQNYLLLETGYPFAFYDFDKISSQLENSDFQLTFQPANNDENFLASNEIVYKLNEKITLLKANNISIGIAGISEHNDFKCSKTTKSLLIEGSIFNAAKIRQQSRILGLRTDRSARYEKALKATYLIEALYRLISLLRISNPRISCKLHTFLETPNKEIKPIKLSYKTIIEILGPINENNTVTNLKEETIHNYLDRLNFVYSYDADELTWNVWIPDERTEDITREIDIIEEIGRLHGFNNFLTTLPKIKAIGKEDLSYQTRKKITSSLLNLGFTEFINYSLVPSSTFVSNDVKLINPLLSDCSNLRVSLLPSLIETVEDNLKQGNAFTEGFEYGHIFSYSDKGQFEENEYVAGIFGGITKKLNWSDNEQLITWFEGKGKIEKLFAQLNLITIWKNVTEPTNRMLHPYRSANVFLDNGQALGIFGQIHPLIAKKSNIAPNTYLFEFNLEVIKQAIQQNKLAIYKEYSLYPKIVKDLSFVINDSVSFLDVKNNLLLNGTEFLSDVQLLDEYRGDSIPENCTSLCIQLTFQSKEKTLETKQIDQIIQKLNNLLVDQFSASIRS